jgi:hypothetical protein
MEVAFRSFKMQSHSEANDAVAIAVQVVDSHRADIPIFYQIQHLR